MPEKFNTLKTHTENVYTLRAHIFSTFWYKLKTNLYQLQAMQIKIKVRILWYKFLDSCMCTSMQLVTDIEPVYNCYRDEQLTRTQVPV